MKEALKVPSGPRQITKMHFREELLKWLHQNRENEMQQIIQVLQEEQTQKDIMNYMMKLSNKK